MFRRRYSCMNNNYNNDYSCDSHNDMIEQQCSNVVSYENYTDSCGCGFDEEPSVFPENPMLAQSYVPYQYMNKTFIPSVEEIEYLKNSNEIGKGCNKCQ